MANYQIPKAITDITGLSVQDYARQQTQDITNYNNQLMQQYEQIAQNQKNALNLNKQNTINQINYQRNDVNQTASDNARQAYINKMLAQKEMKQTLSQAGLATSGQSGTAYGNINNSYGENLNQINLTKANQMRDIDNQVNSANLEFAAKEQELLAEIANQKLNLQKYGTERYDKKYQEAVDNYMKFKNYESTIASLIQQQQQIDNEYNYQQQQYDLALKKYQLELDKANAQDNYYKKFLAEYNAKNQSDIQKKNNDSVNWNIAVNLGYGPVSKKYLDTLVNKGKINASVKNGKITYSKGNNNSIAAMWGRYKF